ncbi:D-tyrosyl-tRNA deacylase [Testicularia cyperi]|uniref:D-aminoacyl-tRNA deacylase n=1 Tax=Testicularia cyperi TaxID=1882483 RepID=A0A317XUE6_9BASI|nr:D-tyrosyl-tRNA deacylase [Testicularia cyperi]
MRAVVQRVKGATVHVDGKLVSKIGPGIVALIGISTEDTMDAIVPLANKILNTKLWNDNQTAPQITVPPQYLSDTASSSPDQIQAQDGKDGNGDSLLPLSNSEASSSVSAPEAQVEEEAGKVTGDRAHQVWGGKPWKRSVVELGGEVLCVSQFTLFARTVKGTKPDFHRAMSGDPARVIYDAFLTRLAQSYRPDRIKDGAFGQMMDVSLTNDGMSFPPVTILLDTTEKK